MSGHLFIVHGDLTQLSCDAWLLPCDISAHPGQNWLRSFDWHNLSPIMMAPTPEWKQGKQRSMKLAYWRDNLPRPRLTNVGARSTTGVPWFIAGAVEFIERATDDLRQSQPKPRNERYKHLLALPVVGTGRGGARGAAGDVVRALVPELARLSAELDVDIALVSNEELTFAATQAQRGTSRSAWTSLEDRLWEECERLARVASSGDLVLFLGAGVSKNAGLPDWGGLLRDLAREAGMLPAELETMRDLGHLDQARAIELRMEANPNIPSKPRPLGSRIASAFSAVHGYAMAHALLAALPVREVVTTNYDTLFEKASSAIGVDVSVLPHAPRSDATRWVLKMHGCTSDPDNIVLTREDYMRYDHRRQALAGIVQALLLMRHMLFVGFSLRDDNFHRIADAVRRARMPGRHSARMSASRVDHFGTALSLFSTPLEQSLWAADLDWVTMEDAAPPAWGDQDAPSKWSAAARQLEIFLDSLVARTAQTTYLLNPRYRGALTDSELALAKKVELFLDEIKRDPTTTTAPAWKQIEELLHRLGLPRTIP